MLQVPYKLNKFKMFSVYQILLLKVKRKILVSIKPEIKTTSSATTHNAVSDFLQLFRRNLHLFKA